MSAKMAVFWVVAPCSLVEVYQRFRGPCCLHHQGDHDATTQKTAIKDLFDRYSVFGVGCSHCELLVFFCVVCRSALYFKGVK
jgi:hypothetical protein